MIISGQALAGAFITKNATGALVAAGAGPAGTLYVNGAATLDPVVIAGANPYSWAVTLPALATGAVVQMYIDATIAGVITGNFVFNDTIGVVPAVPGDAMNTTQWGGVAVGGMPNSTTPPTVGQVADAVYDEMLAGHVLAGSGAEAWAAAAACGAGAGAVEFIYTMTDVGTGLPIDGVQVWVSTDLAGANVIVNGYTDAFGNVTFWLDAGTYYFWRTRAGYSFANPDTETVV